MTLVYVTSSSFLYLWKLKAIESAIRSIQTCPKIVANFGSCKIFCLYYVFLFEDLQLKIVHLAPKFFC